MDKLTKNQLILLLIAVLAVGIGGGMFIGSHLSTGRATTAIPVVDPVLEAPSTPSEATPDPATLHVYVTGAVLHPDVYQLSDGSLVKDALKVAGGTTKEADLLSINLAARLVDNEQVTVPSKNSTVTTESSTGSNSLPAASAKVSINRSSQTDLESLPGIGPAKAQAIITYRNEHGPFKKLEDLQNVKGIGPKTFESLKSLIAL